MENKISFMLLYKETPNFEEVALKSRIERLFGDSLTINMFFTNPESTMVNAAFGGDQLMIAGLYVILARPIKRLSMKIKRIYSLA